MTSLASVTTPAAVDPPAAPPPVTAAPAPAGRRLWEMDALRGLMLVLMTLTHLPTRVSDPAGQPFGYVSAAEGFVLLSAFMAGMVYTQREIKDGGDVMARAFWQRAFKIYMVQAALLVFLFSVVALIAVLTQQDAAKNLMSFFFERPKMAIFSGLLLIYSPPLLDILPMYVLFMLASPIVLLHGRRHGWFGVMALSVSLWLMAQFDLGRALYDVTVQVTGLPVPFPQTGAFELFGWQFLWVLGLWLGAAQADAPDAPPLRFPRWMVHAAIAYALLCFAWRHAVGQVPFPRRAGPEPDVRQVAPGAAAPAERVRAAGAGAALRAAAARGAAARQVAGDAGRRVAAGVLRPPGAGAARAGGVRRGVAAAAVLDRWGDPGRGLRLDVRGGLDQCRGGPALGPAAPRDEGAPSGAPRRARGPAHCRWPAITERQRS